MPAILAAVLELLGLTGTVLGIVQSIQGLLGITAVEHQKYAIETIASNAANTVNHPSWGNHPLLTEILALKDDLDASIASLTLQIEHLTDGTTPVSLPVSPPTGYGGATAADTANSVWTTPFGDFGETADLMFQDLAFSHSQLFRVQHVATPSPFFVPYWNFAPTHLYPTIAQPYCVPSDIVATDDMLGFLAGQNAGALVAWFDGEGGHALVALDNSFDVYQWVTTFDETDFKEMQSVATGISSVLTAPLWPGLAGVTLGAPVALDVGVTITTPMDGILIAITAVPASTSSFNFNGKLSYRYLGAAAFFNDDGDEEAPQNLGFEFETYSPRSMVRAGGVDVRTKPGVSGTITPWLLNS